jgi:predicted lipoprotein with Yx(FWY)xxD motif
MLVIKPGSSGTPWETDVNGTRLAVGLAILGFAQSVSAQPADLPIAPAKTEQFPNGFKVIRAKDGQVYATENGHTLYGMDMRTLIAFGPDPALYCRDECTKVWEPMLAPPGSKPNIAFPRGFGSPPPPAGQAPRPTAAPAASNSDLNPDGLYNTQRAPDWTLIQGASGPQWVYKSWHLVFTRKGDKPGSTAHDGADNLTWNTLKFVPPVPKLTAPQSVASAYRDGAYILTHKDGRVLFTGTCRRDCTDWSPLTAPAAGRGLGEWTVSRSGDAPQWLYRGKPVYVGAALDAPAPIPANGKVLRP